MRITEENIKQFCIDTFKGAISTNIVRDSKHRTMFDALMYNCREFLGTNPISEDSIVDLTKLSIGAVVYVEDTLAKRGQVIPNFYSTKERLAKDLKAYKDSGEVHKYITPIEFLECILKRFCASQYDFFTASNRIMDNVEISLKLTKKDIEKEMYWFEDHSTGKWFL